MSEFLRGAPELLPGPHRWDHLGGMRKPIGAAGREAGTKVVLTRGDSGTPKTGAAAHR